MRHLLNSRFVLLLLCCLGLQLAVKAQAPRLSLKEALDKNLVVLKAAVANGKGSGDKGIELSLVNITCNNIVIDIDPALVFKSKTAGAPEMVLAGNETVNLPSEKMHKLSLSTYYISGNHREPVTGDKYRLQKQNESLVKLLTYINSKHIQHKLAQKAVLSVTDGAALANVYDSHRPRTSQRLQKFIASSINASRSEGSTNKYAAYRPPPVVDTKMFINLDMYFKNTRNLRVCIHDADGFVFPRPANMRLNEYISASSHNVDVELDTANMPHGTYTVAVCDDNNHVWSQKVIKV